MAAIKSISLILFFFAVSVLIIFLHEANGANDLVHQLCQRTQTNKLCTSIIEADPRNNLKSSPNGLCTILRDKAVANAVATKAKISNVLRRTTQPYAVQCLQACSDSYQRAISMLKYADFRVLNHQTYERLNSRISDVDTEVSSCEETFTERPGTLPSPITPENRNLEEICRTIAGILNLTECNKIEACG